VTGWNRPKVTETIRADQPIWFISDLHLGDGTPSDVFFGKDRHLMALIESIPKEGVLVVVGDAMDFHQAWTFTRILRAHQPLLSAMSELAKEGRLFYVVGNHDYDISFYKDLLNFRVCDELHIEQRFLVTHGYEYDPYIGSDLEGSHLATKIHHLLERYLNTWIRVPLGEFYTFPNRLLYWTVHKYASMVRLSSFIGKRFGLHGIGRKQLEHLDYWARTQMGDPMCMFNPIMKRLQEDKWEAIVCGHSHLPGRIEKGGRLYINTGSWTFASSHYALWQNDRFSVQDWLTGREFTDHFYRPIISGAIDEKDFWQWWRENYMGFLRFREGEERQGRLRGWESHIRDYQYLAQFDPLQNRDSAEEQGPVRQDKNKPLTEEIPP
jgi:UDP-2,3-diacylglucosamine pyrophosphatase LpxH